MQRKSTIHDQDKQGMGNRNNGSEEGEQEKRGDSSSPEEQQT
jgi:hypothetical protein